MMGQTIFQILVVYILTTTKVSMGIPLPGVRSHVLQEEQLLSYHNTNNDKSTSGESSYRGSVPAIDRTQLHSPITPTQATTGTAHGGIIAGANMDTTTLNPLAKLLNELYGNDSWRAMLDKAVDQSSIPKTNIADQTTDPKSPQGVGLVNGLYNNHFSSNQQSVMPGSNGDVSRDSSHNVAHPQSANQGSMLVGGAAGGQQSSSIDKEASSKPIPELYTKEQHHSGRDTTTTSSPQHFIQTPQQMNPGTFDPNHSNIAQSFSGTFTNNNTSSFKPGEMTNQHTLYNPNTAFDHFLTQTGSNGDNGKQETMFDPNKVNANIMSQSGGEMFSANKKMQVTESPYGHAQSGYHFSAYKDVKPQTFNADSLNQALIGSHMNMQQPTNIMFMSGKGIEIAAGSTQSTIKPVARMFPTGTSVQKSPTQEYVTQLPQQTQKTKQPSHSSYGNFVPGNLYPGVGTMMGQQKGSGSRQDSSPPEFLHHVPISSGHISFDPNTLNAAQNVYNPNAMSWISTREVVYDETVPDSTAAKQSTTTQRTIPSTSLTTFPAAINTATTDLRSTTTKPSMLLTTLLTSTHPPINSYGSGFDPNRLNANQGQTHFVPGKMAPVYTPFQLRP